MTDLRTSTAERSPQASGALRVCHLIHDLGPGGAEHVLVDLAAGAASAGLDISVVSMMPTGGMRHAADLMRLGVDVRSLELRSWWDPRGPRRLRRMLGDLAPALLHSHLKHADVVAGRAARRLAIPHVSTLHVIEDAVTGLARLKRDLAIRSRRSTAAVTIAVSEAQRRWYLDASGEDPGRVITVPNGIPDPGPADSELRARLRAEFGIPADRVVAAMVAVMRPGKGHDVLLDAEGLTGETVSFLIVGDGELMPAVAERARSRPGRVVLAGYRSDVAAVLSAADLVVHPSRADALPTALMHAAAAGLPVVASAVGGIPEIVTPRTGILVPPGDAEALAAAIDRLALDPETRHRMGAAARARYEEVFSARRWLESLAALYRAVLAQGL